MKTSDDVDVDGGALFSLLSDYFQESWWPNEKEGASITTSVSALIRLVTRLLISGQVNREGDYLGSIKLTIEEQVAIRQLEEVISHLDRGASE